MKAIIFDGPDAARLAEVPEPSPAVGWARVKVKAAGICATDFEVLSGTIRARYPLTPGHEWSGVVDRVGSAADEAWVGRAVTGDNELTCLECPYCRRGEWRRCLQYRQIGFEAAGAYAEYLLVPVRNLHPLADSLSFEQGALLEPLGVGIAVARLSQARLGSTAVIMGAGPIGLSLNPEVVCPDVAEHLRKRGMDNFDRDKSVPPEIATLQGGQRVVLKQTKRAVTPFGGMAVFVSYLCKIDLIGTVRKHMPVCWRSPNRIDPTTTWAAFLIAALLGAKRFAHANWLRGDEALRQLLGFDRFPVDDTIRNLFKQFSMGHVQRFFIPLAEWQMERLPRGRL